MEQYKTVAACGKTLIYYLDVKKGLIAMSNNPICVMNYMLGCSKCAWVQRVKDDSDDIARIEYRELKDREDLYRD